MTSHFRQTAPSDHVVPLGAFHSLYLAVAEGLVGRHWKTGFHLAVVEGDHLGILAESSNQLDFVAQCIHVLRLLIWAKFAPDTPLLSRAFHSRRRAVEWRRQ